MGLAGVDLNNWHSHPEHTGYCLNLGFLHGETLHEGFALGTSLSFDY